MNRLFLAFATILLAADIAVGGNHMPARDTLRTLPQAYYDPTDYNAVRRQFELASRKSFGQRVVEALTQPLIQRENIHVEGHVGLGYTQETDLSFTAVAQAAYKTGTENTPPSVASLVGMVSVNGFFRVAASGVNFLGSAEDKLQYSIGGGSMPVRFWGLGYAAADKNPRSEYVHRSFNTSVYYMRHFVGGLWGGAGINLQYGKGDDLDLVSESYLLEGGQSVRSAFTSALSLRGVYDTRDNAHTTTRGLYLALTYELRPKAFGNYDRTLNRLTFQADYFQPLWQGGVMAVDVYGDIWSSATPWFFWPAIGGSERMRGYYLGRYTDRRMITAQVELRQTIWGPIGACVWGGAGSVFNRCKDFDGSEILPNGGLGLRLAVAGRTVLRVDYGFGRHSQGVIINVNEAF